MKPNVKLLASALAVCLMLSACGGSEGVPVQQVGALFQSSTATASDRFAGVVVSENAVEIKKENEKTVREIYVAEGDQVSEGDKLFSYDADELSLTLDKQKLEVDRLNATIDEKKEQISSVESDMESASGNDYTQLNIQLRQLQTELTQAEYDKAAKQKDVDHTQKMMKDVDVKSPISGAVRKINEQGEGAFMVIQQAGAYEVKGMLNEMSLGAGIMEGTPVVIQSRTDDSKTWNGTVRKVDYNAAQSAGDSNSGGSSAVIGGMGMDSSGMSTSTSYPFYVELESTDGLLLGQHVYIRVGAQGAQTAGLALPESFVMELRYDEQNAYNVAQVWAATQQGKLKKTEVILGEYDPAAGVYPIISGLTEQDYIADPANPNCADGAAVSHRDPADFPGDPVPSQPAEEPADPQIPEQPQEDAPVDAGAEPQQDTEPAQEPVQEG